MKTYYIDTKQVNKEIFILDMVESISKGISENTLKIRNELYAEITKVIDTHTNTKGDFIVLTTSEKEFRIKEGQKETIWCLKRL